ncbi:MAG: hypothetical protein ACYTG4_10450 [Planctomycetota bacterium]|jgi:hypothetical protein
MTRVRPEHERGSAYLLCMAIVTVLVISSAAFVGLSKTQSDSSVSRMRTDVLQSALDGAQVIAMAKIQEAVTTRTVPPAMIFGRLTNGPAAGSFWMANMVRHTTQKSLWKLTTAAALFDEVPRELLNAPKYMELDGDRYYDVYHKWVDYILTSAKSLSEDGTVLQDTTKILDGSQILQDGTVYTTVDGTYTTELTYTTVEGTVYTDTTSTQEAPKEGPTLIGHSVQQLLVVVEPAEPYVPGSLGGALTSYYGFKDVKKVVISGNDMNLDGTANPDGDTYALAHATGDFNFKGGSAKLAGGGETLAHSSDGSRVNSSQDDYPTTPWGALDLTEAEFDSRALTFDTLDAWNAYVDSLPLVKVTNASGAENVMRQFPPSSFVNLTFQDGGTTIFEDIYWGDSQHILVWHHENPYVNDDPDAPKGDATANNIHVGDIDPLNPFMGVAILDDWNHVNGGSYLVGGMLSLSGVDSLEGMQGGFQIHYSSEAIGNAITGAGGKPGNKGMPRLLSYRENVDDVDTRVTLLRLGAGTRTGVPSYDSEYDVLTSTVLKQEVGSGSISTWDGGGTSTR